MNPDELLKISKNTSTVAFHKFVLLSNGRENELFCFFEGVDCQYYSLRIKQYANENYHPIVCGNKDTVLKTYKLINEQEIYKDYKKAFFVDSDFDESIDNPEIYETPCYSIENLYANKNTLSEILKSEFALLETDSEYDTILKLFESEFELFNEKTLFFNAWYAALKKSKRMNGLKSTGVNLDEKLPKEFFCLKIGNINSNYDFEKIKQKFPDSIAITVEEVNETLNELRNSSLPFKLRGKFQIWFFYEFIQFIINDANNTKRIIKKKTKFKVDKSLILSQISQYAITPECLKLYLKKLA